MRQQVPASVLNSWKEIAEYFGRGVRTVQRWEQELQLPVHRIGRGKRSPVYARVPELKFWMATSGISQTNSQPPQPVTQQRATTALTESRRLMKQFQYLVQTVAETSVRQRRQAEMLEKRILEIRSRMK